MFKSVPSCLQTF